jgi:hypothetical protein
MTVNGSMIEVGVVAGVKQKEAQQRASFPISNLAYFSFTKFRDVELTQYRMPVSVGPSSKRCPK